MIASSRPVSSSRIAARALARVLARSCVSMLCTVVRDVNDGMRYSAVTLRRGLANGGPDSVHSGLSLSQLSLLSCLFFVLLPLLSNLEIWFAREPRGSPTFGSSVPVCGMKIGGRGARRRCWHCR